MVIRRIYCADCGIVDLTKEEYTLQTNRPNSGWRCPCGCWAVWAGEFTACYNPECGGEIQIDGDDTCSMCHGSGMELFYEFSEEDSG